MVSLMPAVLIGGPPHAGKSVLTYSLTQALREKHIDHYVLRACPDGEGDWSQEINQDSVRLIRMKGKWTDAFVKLISRDLARRHLPLLVDVGGLPTEEQMDIIRQCTHSLLLLHADDPKSADFWHHLVEINGLLPLASLYSEHSGSSRITSETPVIAGTIAGLERGKLASGALFDLLVARLVSLFAYPPKELEKTHLDMAPVELVANLNTFIEAWAPQTKRWKPEMIAPLLAELPPNTPLAVYGRAPNWVYGALVMYTGEQPFYQFDARLGWVTPPALQVGVPTMSPVRVNLRTYDHTNILTVHPVNDYLDYTEADQLLFPPVSTEQGLVLSGKMPFWLVTALVRLYSKAGVPWIACYYPPLEAAIVVTERTTKHVPGGLIALPIAKDNLMGL